MGFKTRRPKTHELLYVAGVEGNSIYLNRTRIAGPKPWGGGKVLKKWTVTDEDLLRSLKSTNS